MESYNQPTVKEIAASTLLGPHVRFELQQSPGGSLGLNIASVDCNGSGKNPAGVINIGGALIAICSDSRHRGDPKFSWDYEKSAWV